MKTTRHKSKYYFVLFPTHALTPPYRDMHCRLYNSYQLIMNGLKGFERLLVDFCLSADEYGTGGVLAHKDIAPLDLIELLAAEVSFGTLRLSFTLFRYLKM